ncbi:MAG: hypothetical protein KAV82_00015 [Phycisphaerae bacterium]|nr:hypothetical protein [Phycisphaerae bacterium]
MDHPDNYPERLMEYHLGLLEDEQAERMRHEIARSARSASQSRNISQWLELLDEYHTPPPPTHLADQVMCRIEQASPLRITEAVSSLPPSSKGRVFRRPVLSLRELVALAACITLFVGVLVPGFSQQRSRARRMMCASNLGSIYQGVSQYAAGFNGHMPQTAGFVPGINWLQSPRPEVPRMPNSRNRYMLVRLRFVKPDSFICAARGSARTMNADQIDQIDQFDDFPDPENCSFDSQNMAGPTLRLGERTCAPIYADRNPFFEGGKFNTLASLEINSTSHDGGSGQNVLCSDGRVVWTITPMFGPRADNIWQIDEATSYTGTEYQRHPTDSFVIP